MLGIISAELEEVQSLLTKFHWGEKYVRALRPRAICSRPSGIEDTMGARKRSPSLPLSSGSPQPLHLPTLGHSREFIAALKLFLFLVTNFMGFMLKLYV